MLVSGTIHGPENREVDSSKYICLMVYEVTKHDEFEAEVMEILREMVLFKIRMRNVLKDRQESRWRKECTIQTRMEDF